MATAWNWDLLDEYLATDISKFVAAEVPALAADHPESEHWVFNYFLNSQLRARFASPSREFAYVFLRRTMAAFEEYEAGRAKTVEFMELRSAGKQPVRTYLSALHHWEQCLAAAWQAIEVWMTLTGQVAFAQGDESPAESLNRLYNRSKHTNSAITKFADQMPVRGPLAVWLSNEGLRSVERLLTWAALKDQLDELAQAADVLQDPTLIGRPRSED
jgi:hypothetical protein